MGEVYRAIDPSLDRSVALKVLPVQSAGDEDRVRRFQQEARAASALNHPGIVHVYELGEAELEGRAVPFIAMELLDGGTLRQHLARKEIVEWIAQVCDALAVAHDAGIVHRDLKPENIIITSEGRAKVVDFGLAKLIERPSADSDAATLFATQKGIAVGTPAYMSPEQLQGRAVDRRTDIYAIGCILKEAGVDTIARRCMQPRPEDRYGSVREVAAALRAHRRVLPFAAAAIVVAIAVAIVVMKDRRRQQWSTAPQSQRMQNLAILARPQSAGERGYFGAPISISLRNAEVRDVMASIAILTGLNISVAPDVTGSVTVHAENLPWDQVFDQTLRQNRLRYRIEQNVVVIERAMPPPSF
jgi:predicted Ser/Thr protein kinase